MMSDKMLELNLFEMRYFLSIMKERIIKSTGINPMKLNLDWPALKQSELGTWPPANPNWFKQQELMAQLTPFLQGGGG